MDWPNGNIALFFSGQSSFDRAYLHNVKSGFSALSGSYNQTEVLVLVGLLAVLILLIALLYLRFRPPARHLVRGNVDLVQDPKKIRDIIERSVTLRAVYDIEIFDQKYRQIYRGAVLGINPDGDLEVEFNSFTDPNLDFANKPLRAGFRMSRRGEQEFYQFNSTSRFYGVSRNFERREKSIRIAMPNLIERSQKRRFVRVEPAGGLRFKVRIMDSKKKTEPIPVMMFFLLHEAEVMDISVGGLQVLVEGRPTDLGLEIGQEVVVTFRPPVVETGEWLPKKVMAKARILSLAPIMSGGTETSDPDGKIELFHQVRLEFIGRGKFNPAERNISFRPANALAFEDLSRWIQAYQRHEIQEQKDTKARPDMVPNVFAARSGPRDQASDSMPEADQDAQVFSGDEAVSQELEEPDQ